MADDPCAPAKAIVKKAEAELGALEAELESAPPLTAKNIDRRQALPALIKKAKERQESERRMLAECIRLSGGSRGTNAHR